MTTEALAMAAIDARIDESRQKSRRPSDFLRGIVQTEFPLAAFDRMGKLPVFYYDNSSMTAVFTASTRQVRALLPDARMHPIELFPGRCVVAFSAFEYRDTDIDPYNEFSISFLMSYGHRTLPGIKLLHGLMTRCFEAYVWKLPVTTEIARWGGVELYGYPKFVADIEFRRPPGRTSCLLSEGGRNILMLEGQALAGAPAKPLRYRAYSMKNGIPLCANVYTHPLQYAQTMSSDAASLTLGDHDIARQLQRLELSASPLMYQYCPLNELVLFGPRNLIDD
ncbi:conserved protein of unknown function [Sterolibacterium denitrificans]|uniref:Acetoacetate decarboxylase n=1 Tax=Sterolibacterium denitrificans TaxID=157592 RepID=A0A7Z7HQE3_9PROT|nr:acetoacetate decarboxylase family protein [Sterolibacterium denitrificans]SMB24915.1 conserved protein of unknown function [Sterolibacterium denitrificans]